MASRVPLTYEMSPTVHTEADIESAVAVAKQVAEAVEEEEGSADDLHPRLTGTTTTAFQPSPVVVVPGSVTIVVECHNDADAAADGGTGGSRITTTNNNSASMKCLNFTTSPHASARNTHAASGQGCISNTTVQAGGSETTTSSPSPPLSLPTATTTTTVDSAKSNQFVNHSFSCGRGEEDMGTSGSVVVASEDCAEAAQTQPGMTELARGFADVVRVSTSVPQPVTVSCCATGPGGNGVAPRGTPTADNDDMLEASNRSESQLEISAAGIGPGAGGLRGRVLPKLQTLEQTTRPIYPNVPYSPYNSPYGSPRSGRRRTPLRESRRVSIEQSGSFLQLNQYKLLDQIGQGSYGLVKLAYSEEDSTHYAMKILSKRKLLRKAGLMRRGPKRGTSPLDRVYREIAVLKKLDHPNVVKLVEVLDDPLEDSLYLVFELVQQGEVLSIPTETPLSEERAWNVFRDVLLGVEYLHYQRIIHGDLKPANLLLSDSGSVKVADLGVCNEFLGEDAAMNNGSTAGTPAFRAPETLLPGQHFYNGKAADIWALGATLFSLVHGNVPFIATSVPGVYEKIKNDPLEFPANCSSATASTISEELRDLISRMLDKDPQQRITLPQIKEHPWMTKHGTVRLPSEEENCRLVQISDEDMSSVVKSIPKLDTLILIKTMLKKHSFQNPFTKGISGRAPQAGGSRLERFCRSGRSNSAPGDYHTSERQPSSESLLPSVTEGVTSPLGSPDATSTVATITTGSIISELDSLTLRSDVSCPSSSTDNDTATSLLSTSYYEVLL
ncbi:calcium/calmodulin-dependent protein kinase kinase 1 isoform X1 [Anopheles arabiensis]|uniref:calcium/calmodulin-dependent protein kinase kinase 1 isoform X1 n=1 Tax=Anopheles arabiensis TaxID=7173 RepID=UPI001AACE8B6|nr:calcium/calmodulin-dependent protein kinase kinase 1 isoform X1 [Anopheles arabiensis]XP_040154585.1 calcium/calmodulin-dependent protein kinase kinase 1 isoform X1 [Anopheles arabiensis]XP_040154586.1 calcium/calmodulin-dependent protein kinase kinase 1 isoform X1 [Anopheles arabiensis]XP_040154587.1 calcium/calmodulin-dependent protein kinase kinase 1 isoform X1 [Anopheles arabiensis]